MKVFFSCTTYQFDQYRSNYFLIRDFLTDSGHVITHDWLNSLRTQKTIPTISKNEYARALKGVEKADVLIFESTLPSFSTGHWLTLGLQMKKPILVMWLDSSPWVSRKGFIESIERPNLELTSYNRRNYQRILTGFLNKYRKFGTKHRFNLVIEDSEWQYLEWLNYQSFKTRSAIIRESIQKSLVSDEAYHAFLSKGVAER